MQEKKKRLEYLSLLSKKTKKKPQYLPLPKLAAAEIANMCSKKMSHFCPFLLFWGQK